jgi:protease I
MRMRLLNAACLLILVFAVFVPAHAALKESRSRPQIVMVVAPKDFTDQEYADPRAVFDNAGAVVRVASLGRETAIGHGGTRLRVDQAIREITLDQFDAIVIVGGTGALAFLMDDEALRNIIVAACKSGKVVAALCVAPAVLAHAGVLRNMQATCYPDTRIISVLKQNGADYCERSVVISGRIVTANGPEAARDFALRVLDVLKDLFP